MDKWNSWYKNFTLADMGSFRYSDTETYLLGFQFLFPYCLKIEDWGCGVGGFKRFFIDKPNIYVGIDGSYSPFADKKSDLCNYTSNCEGIFMRHVLEHNYNWEQILENACRSFTKRMVLVLFTPLSLSSHSVEIAHNRQHGVDVPDLSLSEKQILKIFKDFNVSYEKKELQTDTGYNLEIMYFLTKEPQCIITE